MTEIINKCLRLPIEQRKELIFLLKESIADGNYKRFRILLKLATEVVGEGILSNSREFNCLMGRRMVAYQMRQEGCSLYQIGKFMKKDHATIHHTLTVMEDILQYPTSFKVELHYWKEFQKKLQDYEINN